MFLETKNNERISPSRPCECMCTGMQTANKPQHGTSYTTHTRGGPTPQNTSSRLPRCMYHEKKTATTVVIAVRTWIALIIKLTDVESHTSPTYDRRTAEKHALRFITQEETKHASVYSPSRLRTNFPPNTAGRISLPLELPCQRLFIYRRGHRQIIRAVYVKT